MNPRIVVSVRSLVASAASALVPAALVLVGGCGNEKAARPPVNPSDGITNTTAANSHPRSQTLAVSDDISKACKLDFGSVERAPKFDFDRSDVLSSDRAVLEQIARCVTTGPLKGRVLKLIGRADQRGMGEYNLALGAHRSNAAGVYLEQLGVGTSQVVVTSRGELDATGTDENGWARDCRVDITLQ